MKSGKLKLVGKVKTWQVMNTCGTKGGLSQCPDREIAANDFAKHNKRTKLHNQLPVGHFKINFLSAHPLHVLDVVCLPVLLRNIRLFICIYKIRNDEVTHLKAKVLSAFLPEIFLLRKSQHHFQYFRQLYAGSFIKTNPLSDSVQPH